MSENNIYSDATPAIVELANKAREADLIASDLYTQYDVKRGLRDINGRGVLAGLTHVSEVRATKMENGELVSDYGSLIYRGYDIKDLVNGCLQSDRFGFEEIAYLLLFGNLPDDEALSSFNDQLIQYRNLPTGFVRDCIMKAPSRDIMNTLSRSVLTLYSYDDNANDVSLPNVVRQCMELISRFPLLSVYGYSTMRHYYEDDSLFVIPPLDHGSFAENLLHILRPDGSYTDLEAKALDAALVLHMDHGGGNNSTFTTHVVSSSMTDTYSVIAAALGSLKGPRHGGANIKVSQMFEDMEQTVKDWKDRDEVSAYLTRLLDKDGFDHSGLIYGVGHAVYSLSDPRAELLEGFVRNLAEEKGRMAEFDLYHSVAELAPGIIADKRKMYKGVCINVDFYSGLLYEMLGLPKELYTPLFAMARIVGWSAHRIEELSNASKIIRPAFKSIEPDKEYIPTEDR
ncbi:MAG: citrate/2-methylcitrate synthase [Clostridia bacterium]|nr:citrate/2-methylcitrate synthase [Clostridia bacterium]